MSRIHKNDGQQPPNIKGSDTFVFHILMKRIVIDAIIVCANKAFVKIHFGYKALPLLRSHRYLALIYIDTYMYTYIHLYIHIYIYTHIYASVSLSQGTYFMSGDVTS
jgi:hypothetical protein